MDADEADKLRAALHHRGFFLVTNHGIEDSLMDAMMSASREFFRQPMRKRRNSVTWWRASPLRLKVMETTKWCLGIRSWTGTIGCI